MCACILVFVCSQGPVWHLVTGVTLLHLQLAVLGSCLCHGLGGSPCACAQMAASARKMLLKLKQEVSYYQNTKSFGFVSLVIKENICNN